MKIFTEKPRVFLLLILVIVAISIVNGKNAQQKNVQVSLRAKWPGTSILLEAGELLADERKDYFWEFITKWLESNSQHLTSSKECFQEILKHGNYFLSNHLASFYQLSLISRLASPKVVVYRQLAQESLLSKQYEKIDDKGKRNATDMHSSSKGDKDRWSISRNPDSPKGSCCWVDVGSAVLFDVPELSLWIDNSKTMSQDSREPETFMFDHVYPESNRRSNKAILYAAPGTKCFSKFHSALVDASNKGKAQYVLRPVLPNGCELEADYCATVGTGKTINLGGYGVELALKNMEYKAMDDSVVKKGVVLEDPRTEDLSQEVRGFIFSKLLERKPELTSDLMTFRDSLLSSTVSDTLDVWELKDLGHQTVQRIIQASDPFHTMQEINQNFPFVVSSLSRMKVSEHVKDEIISNQRMIPPGKCLMAINGALINAESIDLFSMMELIHEELSLAGQLSKFNIPHKDIKSLLYTTESSEQSSIRLDFRTSDVHYLNNLEEDSMYRRWRSNLNELLMPIFPGQFHYIRKNLYHAVYVIDPSSLKGLKVVDTIMYLHDNNVPMRFGIILFSSKAARNIEENDGEIPDSFTLKNAKPQKQQDDTASTIISLFYYIKEKYDVKMAFKFLYELNTLWEATKADEQDLIELSFIEDAFIETVRGRADSTPQEILLKLENDLSFIEKAYESTHSVCKLGLTQLNPTLLMNGLVYGNVQAQEAALQAMSEELPRIQEKVYYRQIDSHSDILETFLSEQSHLRHNPKIVQEEKDHQSFVSLTAFVLRNDSIFSKLQFLHSPKTEDDVKPVTHLIVVDLTSKEGLKLLLQGVRYLLHGSERSRIGILYNSDIDVPNFEKLPTMFLINTIQISLSFKQRHKTLDFLKQLITWYEKEYLTDSNKIEINVESFIEAVSKLAEANDLKHDIVKSALSNLSLDSTKIFLQKVITFLSSEIGLMPGDNAVVTNGRVLLQNGQRFLVDDFKLLEAVEYEKRIKSISSVIEQVEWTGIDPDELTSDFLSNAVMAISSAMNVRSRSSEKARFEMLNAEHSAVVQESENSFIHIDAVIDPLSSLGQKLAPLLRLAVEWFQPSTRIILNPVTSLADLPLKNFYRYVVPSEKELTSDSSSEGPIAWFSNMPLSKTLTMNLDVPEPWLVEPVIAIHDLDNIVLENLGDTVTLVAVFELEALVLTGHCSEKDHDPPRGLQFFLGTKSNPHLEDTLVMANLGYWQLKASPGVWSLSLAPGRSSDLYTLEGTNKGTEEAPKTKRIILDSFGVKPVHLQVVKKKGKEKEKLLTETDDVDDEDDSQEEKKGWNSGLLKWASGLISSDEKNLNKYLKNSSVHKPGERKGETINIFSIASGHLYERFLKIMILSVLKNTDRPVKFWFIKNYLSPQFKDVIPHMAKEYGFDYELITYKWPTWLHKQTEKQRIIWAYKILFLDVIFPLNLKKVIFVDADQIIRTDMGELYDMNIKGKPLAYTPFCDNNKEMDGYRFWKQGFWKDHLRGRPYHISALYVVDLEKFRQMAAGDTLRVVYETLSKDPNSLSNLDQDLPNYAQHTVPIFSLPQEWLWCESWCGNATKSKSKTIDLCNNPMTKEPKLQGARRIVSEWPALDEEARSFTKRILGDEIEESVTPDKQVTKDSSEIEDSESRAEL